MKSTWKQQKTTYLTPTYLVDKIHSISTSGSRNGKKKTILAFRGAELRHTYKGLHTLGSCHCEPSHEEEPQQARNASRQGAETTS